MKKRKVGLLLIIALGLWIITDLFYPVRTDIRQFDSNVVAELDTKMWRSYYERQPLKLFTQLAKLMRKQFDAPFWRSQIMAYHAGRAAFVFKDGQERSDYEKALPDLERYFGIIHKMSTTPFDIKEAARLELEWWIVHRQRAQTGQGQLEKVLAEAMAVVYQVPPESLHAYARFRAEAMHLRDAEAESDGVSEEEWLMIRELLDQCWDGLYRAVNAGETAD